MMSDLELKLKMHSQQGGYRCSLGLRSSLLLILLLCACDVEHGFETSTFLKNKPNSSCITKALNELGKVEYNWQDGGGMEIHGQQILEIDSWFYGDDLRVDVYKTASGWEYHNGNVRLSSPKDKPSLRQEVPSIHIANRLLETSCDLPVSKLPIQEF